MSYIPTTWANNDAITIEKMNKIEQGIASQSNEVFIIHITKFNDGNSVIADATFAQVEDAFFAGKAILIMDEQSVYPMEKIDNQDNTIAYYNTYNSSLLYLSSSTPNILLQYSDIGGD